MRLKWSKAELEYFSKPIPTAEWNYDWVVWLIMAVTSLAGLAYLYMEVMK